MKMKKLKCYRFVTENMKSENGNVSWKIGKWNKHKGKIDLCSEGFHASIKPLDSLNFIFGERWFISEAKGKIVHDNDKIVADEMRLVKELPIKKIVVWFAIACAKRSIKRYEKKYDDNTPRKAIELAEKWLKNPKSVTTDELRSAAWSAESAASSATSSAAWSAARSAESAAWSAARSAESAASSATSSAAWSAESADWSAESAASSAAWSAARSADWSAEKIWQNKKLEKIIDWCLKNEGYPKRL